MQYGAGFQGLRKKGNGKGKGYGKGNNNDNRNRNRNNKGNGNRRKASLRQSGSAFGAAVIGRAEALSFRFKSHWPGVRKELIYGDWRRPPAKFFAFFPFRVGLFIFPI